MCMQPSTSKLTFHHKQSIPGQASLTCDSWTADTTSSGFIGLTLHWIHVDESGKWSLKSAVIGMRGLSGDHGGKNMGRYVVGLCDHVGLIGKVPSYALLR
jgi:hypothetical protein